MYLVQHFLEESARRLPDKVALICGDQRLTYSEINQMADRLAAALVEMGIKRQDRVAIFLDNSAEAVIALFAILKAGAVFIMLSATMKARKLNYILNHSGARVLVTHRNKARIVRESIPGAKDLKHVIWKSGSVAKGGRLSPDRETGPRISHDYESLVSGSADRSTTMPGLARCAAPVDLDLATIIYTSGSTGDPKGVMCAHYNVVSAARSISTYLDNVEDDIILCCLPLSFDYGLYQVLVTFLFGGAVILEKFFAYPYRIVERLVEERVSGFPIVPTMAAILLQMEDISKLDFGFLRYITNTAAALPVAHIKKLQALFPKTKIFSMYGLTECKLVSYLPPEELKRRPDSVGIPMPNEEIKIVDNRGCEVGSNTVGELVVRGSNVMQGYWNDPVETELRFKSGRNRRDTLLFSGDLFRKDEDGFLYFVARKDDLIKTSAERVSPKEIENCLCEHDNVAEAAVIGVADDILGQAIKAFVIVTERIENCEMQLMRHCQENLEPFMVPKYIEIRETLPKLSSGKVDKKKLSS